MFLNQHCIKEKYLINPVFNNAEKFLRNAQKGRSGLTGFHDKLKIHRSPRLLYTAQRGRSGNHSVLGNINGLSRVVPQPQPLQRQWGKDR